MNAEAQRRRGGNAEKSLWRLSLLSYLCVSASLRSSSFAAPMPIVQSEFIFESAPFPSCHASTIAQTPDGLVAAWFGGTRERAPDVGIWVSRRDDHGWSTPAEVANGIQPTGPRLPCWNPALYQSPGGPLLLFFKIGPTPQTWWGMLTTSTDQGVTWAAPHRLPDDILGPAKDKPLLLSDGSLLCPTGIEGAGTRIHFERTTDLGQTWTVTPFLNDGKILRLVQPTLLDHGGGHLQFLARNRTGNIYQGWSADNGKSWTDITPTDLPCPNSGIDALELADVRSLVVFDDSPKVRTPLTVAVSPDGKAWKRVLVLEDGPPEYSYPAVIQTRDGMIHITYTWLRKRIRHVVLDPKLLQ
jgi:predicted neuraminidase